MSTKQNERNEQIIKELNQKHGKTMNTLKSEIKGHASQQRSVPFTTSLSKEKLKEACDFLGTAISNAVKEDEKELERPMTYSEMRARYG